MKKLVSIFLMLLITAVSVYGLEIQNIDSGKNLETNQDDNDADIPLWNVGDSWTYECVMNGGKEDLVDLYNIKFTNLEFVVNGVLADFYKTSLSGGLSGSLSAVILDIPVSGSLRSTTIQGTTYVNKSTLTIDRIEDLLISGYIKPSIAPQISFDFIGDVFFSYGITPLDFPINRYDSWFVEDIGININGSAELGNLFSEDVDMTIYIQQHTMECEKWDNINVDAGAFDALKIIQTDPYPLTEEEHSIWFSPEAGNVVKVESREVPFSWGGWGYYDFDMNLLSTTFEPTSNPPNIPDKPDGPEVIDVGTEGMFESSATDPDNDIVKLVFDWGDGKTSSSDFVKSDEVVTVSHTWTTTKEEPFLVKVKARDKFGKESSWSEELAVSVINDPPEKPLTPDGPTGGKGGLFGKTYTYTTSADDPNLHRVKYGWDWDGDMIVDQWTAFYDSGETVSASHKWTTKGEYDIRVKAVDEYDAEGNWSDPLKVSMPKTKTEQFSILQKLMDLFPILEKILERICFVLDI